jgi:hypothetical protein
MPPRSLAQVLANVCLDWRQILAELAGLGLRRRANGKSEPIAIARPAGRSVERLQADHVVRGPRRAGENRPERRHCPLLRSLIQSLDKTTQHAVRINRAKRRARHEQDDDGRQPHLNGEHGAVNRFAKRVFQNGEKFHC